MRDAVQLCAAEPRLTCLKEAMDRKIVGKERREFVRSCPTRPAGQANEPASEESDDAPRPRAPKQ
jgi:hypothetical protein